MFVGGTGNGICDDIDCNDKQGRLDDVQVKN